VWFVAYHHSLRLDEAGVKFVLNEAASVVESERLALLGHLINTRAPISKARIEAFMARYAVRPWTATSRLSDQSATVIAPGRRGYATYGRVSA
jgi:hypothetical protein